VSALVFQEMRNGAEPATDVSFGIAPPARRSRPAVCDLCIVCCAVAGAVVAVDQDRDERRQQQMLDPS
jgi:hypothetical protein